MQQMDAAAKVRAFDELFNEFGIETEELEWARAKYELDKDPEYQAALKEQHVRMMKVMDEMRVIKNYKFEPK